MSKPRWDVVVLGMGPVGCLATILLAKAGLRVAAIERDEEVYKLPRAVNLDGEIVRALQPVDLAEQVNAMLQTVREGERAGFADAQHKWLFGRQSSDFGSNGWQPANMFDQPELEGYLRSTALSFAHVDAFVGFAATDIEDDGNQVTVTIEKDGQAQDIVGAYLMGCDGAASTTRKWLGSGWLNLGYDHDWLVVDVVTKPGHTLGTTTMQVCDPDRIMTYVCTKDPYRRWEFKLNDGETWEEMLAPEKIRELIDAWTPPDTYEIRRAAMYQFHAATADTWHSGRVFIGGDAAHQTPPFLGQGMNAGMRDVINFAWKLPMVIAGTADQALLHSYQAERDAHAHDLVEWAVSIGHLMEHITSVERAKRAGAPEPETPPALMSAGYGQGREAPPLRAGVLMQDQVSKEGITGYIFSQPILRVEGSDKRMDDLLGDGFAVVGKTTADINVSARSREILVQIGAKAVSIEHLEISRGHFDRGFEQADVIIVRPDRYIFGHADGQYTLDQLIDNLAAKLHLK